jgi:hypothetical protein
MSYSLKFHINVDEYDGLDDLDDDDTGPAPSENDVDTKFEVDLEVADFEALSLLAGCRS